MGGMVAAWAVGETIVIWRAWKVRKAPPMPGQLLATSALFVLLALLAESDTARPLAVTLAWGFDMAAFLNIAPAVITGAGKLKTEPTGPASSGKPAPKVSTA